MVKSSAFLSNRGLWYYTILNYIDKGLNFVIPFLILKSQTAVLYADVEYLIGISLLISSFTDLGLRQYLFYAYRNIEDGEQYCLDIRQSVYIMMGGYVVISLLIYSFIGFNNLLLYCLLRCVFLTFINIEGSICRLDDKPMAIFKYSLSSNLLVVGVLAVSVYAGVVFDLTLYSSIYILFAAFFIIKMLQFICEDKGVLAKTISLMKKSLYYSYPLILMLVMTNIQNNIAKIYGYQKLSIDDYQSLAILLRCFTFLLLAHASVIAFCSKDIYTSKGGIEKKAFYKYLYFIFSAFIIMFFLILFSNYFSILKPIAFDSEFFILVVTYFCMMIRAYIEQYFGKYALLKYPVFSTSFSFGCFVISFIFLLDIYSNFLIMLLSILMFSEIINMSLIIYFYKLKLKKKIYV